MEALYRITQFILSKNTIFNTKMNTIWVKKNWTPQEFCEIENIPK